MNKVIRRVESEGVCEGTHLPVGHGRRIRPMNVQQLGHLCQLIRGTQQGPQKLVTLGTSLGQLLCQLAGDGGTVILDHWYGVIAVE